MPVFGKKGLRLCQWFSCFSTRQTHLEVVLRHGLLGPIPRVSHSTDLGEGPTTGISNKFPGDAPAAGRGTTL